MFRAEYGSTDADYRVYTGCKPVLRRREHAEEFLEECVGFDGRGDVMGAVRPGSSIRRGRCRMPS